MGDEKSKGSSSAIVEDEVKRRPPQHRLHTSYS